MKRSWLVLLAVAACTPQKKEEPAVTTTSDAGPAVATASATAATASATKATTSGAASAGVHGTVCAAPSKSAKPVKSSDGKTTAWVETDASRSDPTGSGDVPHGRLCVAAGAAGRLLLEGHSTPETASEQILAGFDNLLFSPDASTLYFTTDAWATSTAVHSIEVATGKEHFLVDGQVLEVLKTGAYAGNLLVSSARLDPDHKVDSPDYRGRIEVFTVVSPAGKTIAKLPEDEAARKKKLFGAGP